MHDCLLPVIVSNVRPTFAGPDNKNANRTHLRKNVDELLPVSENP